MKIREFILVLSVVAVVALLLSRDNSDNSITKVTTGEKTTGSSARPIPISASTPAQIAAKPLKAPNEYHAPSCDYEIEIANPPTRDVALTLRGEEIFNSHCALCHGLNLDGTGDGGRSLLPPPTDLRLSKNFKYGSEPENIFHSAMYGIERTGCAPWDGIITPHDMWAISFYIESRLDRR